MKRRELLRHLEANGCFCARDTGPRSIWKNPSTNEIQPVPRHREIDSHLCRRICRRLSLPDPPSKWQRGTVLVRVDSCSFAVQFFASTGGFASTTMQLNTEQPGDLGRFGAAAHAAQKFLREVKGFVLTHGMSLLLDSFAR